MVTASCLSFPVLFLPACSSHEVGDGAAGPHPGWHEHPPDPLISCLRVAVTTFPGAGMAILVLQLVTLPFMCQVWMSPPPKPETALEHRAARGCPLTANSLWKTPKKIPKIIFI